MKFTKLHGLGNDYIYLDGLRENLPPENRWPELSRRMSDRHFGVGADGIILVLPSGTPGARFRMRIFNADGSEAEMCGNGVRAFARYVFEHGLTDATEIPVETGAGIITPSLILEGGVISAIRVDMGVPRLRPEEIPVADWSGNRVVGETLTAGGRDYAVTCVSMGNPHCVVFVDELAAVDLQREGPALENHPAFPRRTNVEFVRAAGPAELFMRVWERGSGVTLACGTGACAALVAAALNGLTGRDAVIHLDGGDLRVTWAEDGHVYLTGPAEEVFEGEYNLKGL